MTYLSCKWEFVPLNSLYLTFPILNPLLLWEPSVCSLHQWVCFCFVCFVFYFYFLQHGVELMTLRLSPELRSRVGGLSDWATRHPISTCFNSKVGALDKEAHPHPLIPRVFSFHEDPRNSQGVHRTEASLYKNNQRWEFGAGGGGGTPMYKTHLVHF